MASLTMSTQLHAITCRIRVCLRDHTVATIAKTRGAIKVSHTYDSTSGCSLRSLRVGIAGHEAQEHDSGAI